MNNDIWRAARLTEEWESGNLHYMLFTVPREEIDGPNSDESDALLLVGIDDDGVRRTKVMMDTRLLSMLDGLLSPK